MRWEWLGSGVCAYSSSPASSSSSSSSGSSGSAAFLPAFLGVLVAGTSSWSEDSMSLRAAAGARQYWRNGAEGMEWLTWHGEAGAWSAARCAAWEWSPGGGGRRVGAQLTEGAALAGMGDADAPSRALAARIPRPWQGKFWIELLVLADPTTPHYYRSRAVVAIPACAYHFGACLFVVCL